MLKQLALPVACILALGCRSAGQVQPLASQATAPNPDIAAPQEAEGPAPGFSLSRIMEFAGFQKSDESPGIMPPVITEVGNTIDAVLIQANDLNIQDPPELTAQKAQGLLTSLGSWERLLASARTLMNEDTATALNGLVGQLRGRLQSLIQNGANPETIAAVQHLAGQLKQGYGGLSALFSDGSAAYQALVSTTQR